MIRWLDFNDTWLAAEWGHPLDNLDGILATADWLSRNAIASGKKPLSMKDVLIAMVKRRMRFKAASRLKIRSTRSDSITFCSSSSHQLRLSGR